MKSRRILIAHEQKDTLGMIRDSMRTSAKSAGCRLDISMTQNGETAFQWYAESRKPENGSYDLVILGTQLCEWDGIDVILRILCHYPDANIFVCWSKQKQQIEETIAIRQKEKKEYCGVINIKYLDSIGFEQQLMQELIPEIPETFILSPASPPDDKSISPISLLGRGKNSPAMVLPASPTLNRPISPPRDENSVSEMSIPGQSPLIQTHRESKPEVEVNVPSLSVIKKEDRQARIYQNPIQSPAPPSVVGHFAPPPPVPLQNNRPAEKSQSRCCFW